jgi:potassium voltage-gated channel Eag-related subfamily H protein 7
VKVPGQEVWESISVRKELWSDENLVHPVETLDGDMLDTGSTLGFSIFGERDSIHRSEAHWVLRKRQLESATASLVERKWYILSPQMVMMQRWDLVTLLALVYTASVTPYEVGVLRNEPIYMKACNYCIDVIFLTDVIFNFFLAYFDTHVHQWMYDQRMIAIHYMEGWFTIDVISILPFDQILAGGGKFRSLRLLRLVRLTRILKLLRIVRAKRIASRIRFFQMFANNAVLRLCKFLGISLTLLHWTACIWAFVPELEIISRGIKDPIRDDYRFTWLGDVFCEDDENGECHDSAIERYVQSLEFAMCAMVMDFAKSSPQNLFEQIFAIVLCLIMGSVYGYMIGTVCSVVSSMDPATTEYNTTMDTLNQFLAEIRLEDDHANEVRDYFRYCRSHFRNAYYKELLQFMSPALRGMVTRHQHSVWIRQVWFFNCDDTEERTKFVTDVGLALQLEAYSPNELIIRTGDTADAMYIVQRGLVAIQGRPRGIGRFFGEDMILEGCCFTYTARVLTYLDVHALSRESLVSILEKGHFPGTKKLIHLRVNFMKFQAKIKLLVKAVKNESSYTRSNGDQLRAWRADLKKNGKDVDKRKELKANELVQSKQEEMSKKQYFQRLYQVGIQNMSNIELQNARANGTVDADAEDAPEDTRQSPLRRRSTRASMISQGVQGFKGGDEIGVKLMSVQKNVSTLREDMESRMENMERLLQMLVDEKSDPAADLPKPAE